VEGPRLAESNVGKADGTPSKESSETRQGQEPVENDWTRGVKVDVCKSSENEDKENGPEWATGAIDVGEERGSVTLLSKGDQCTRSSLNTGDTNGNDRDHNDNIHEVVESDESSILANDDEWRGRAVTITGANESLIIRPDEETNEEQTEDIETIFTRQWRCSEVDDTLLRLKQAVALTG
jgi:hypothetical protein